MFLDKQLKITTLTTFKKHSRHLYSQKEKKNNQTTEPRES